MNVIIVGCGKLGSGLAQNLDKKKHTVTVIDTDNTKFALLGGHFQGRKITGVGFDKDVMERAGIKMADAVIACTINDETNALVGRIARNIYRVPRVISRLYDPRKAEIYQTLGIQTICTTTWGIKRVTELLSYRQLDSVLTIGDTDVDLVRIDVPELLVGKTVQELTSLGEYQVVSIGRNNQAFIPMLGTTFEHGDIIYISVLSPSVYKLKSRLGLA